MTQTELTPTASLTGKWKPYPAYKDSGVEWLGEIPEHWEVFQLRRIVNTFVDYRGFTPVKTSEGIPLITARNIKSGILDFTSSQEFISEEDYASRMIRGFPERGDLLITTEAPLGETAQIVDERVTLAQRIILLKVDKRQILNEYLKFYFISKSGKGELSSRATGSTAIGIKASHLREINVITPLLSEQQAIVDYLDRETARINALIAKKERLIELLQEKRAALISHAVTKGLDSTMPMRDSGVEWLGEIPVHWEVKRLKHVASILRGKFSHRARNDPRLYDGPYPFIQTGDITATTKYITDYQQTLNELGFAVSKQFPSYTLVMAIAANIGDLAILQFPACFPDSIVGFVPTSEIALDYLYYNLTAMKQEMVSTATLNTQLNLNVERIGGLFTICPPFGEQHAIATYLDSETTKIDALISRILEGVEKLKEYSTALISAAVTGKIDVREEYAYAD